MGCANSSVRWSANVDVLGLSSVNGTSIMHVSDTAGLSEDPCDSSVPVGLALLSLFFFLLYLFYSVAQLLADK